MSRVIFKGKLTETTKGRTVDYDKAVFAVYEGDVLREHKRKKKAKVELTVPDELEGWLPEQIVFMRE